MLMFYIMISILIILFTLYLPTVENKIWTRQPNVTYLIPSFPATTISEYYDDVLAHIDDSHWYSDEKIDTADKYKDAKVRIRGWKRVYARLRIHHQNLSTHHQNLRNIYQQMKLDKQCSDFFRDYIPLVERNYLQPKQGFKEDFIVEHPFFIEAYNELDTELHKIKKVYRILKSTGLKFKNRTLCSFKYMSTEEYNGPVPADIMNWDANERGNLNKCEQWIFFLYAVKRETSTSRSSEIQMWQSVIDSFEEFTNKPYPMLVQNILHAFYRAHHQYHHGISYEKADAKDGGKNAEKMISNPDKMMRCMFKGFVNWQTEEAITLFSQTTPWTTPKFQERLKGKKPTAKVTEKVTVSRKFTWFPTYTRNNPQEDGN